MKKIVLVAIISLSIFTTLNAQQIKGITGENNWFSNWTNFKPSTTDYDDATQLLTGTISANLKLTKGNTYRLVGIVYVTNNAVLTIEPGTVIRGDKETCGTLVITKGSKIIAEGSATDPIVFTSNNNISERRPGDWGGIVILGEAPINKIGGVGYLDFNFDPAVSYYGGQDPNNNSGILKYVRIEYAGRKINALKELNGLSLAGVGKSTKLEFIQISFSNDDSFECYGGDVNFNNLISYRATDDDFDFTQGVQCNIANSIAIRNPYSSDISGSRCFEIDSYDKIENADVSKKLTKIIANNITLVNTEDNNQGLVREAIYIKEKSYFSLNNSIVDGFSSCVLLENKIGANPINLAKINILGLQINRCNGVVLSETAINNPDLISWYNSDTFSLEFSKLNNAELFIQSDVKKSPDFRKKISTVVTSTY
ncbi:hypothetical protein [Flavobacterium laiguense]|uniref:T9SS C-terminal target domain-containing protein n=1 Tax=Flavobacterium laiguense TaxID=2169409 RepID=A0A2U1K0L1_9FLAO|nr:hypothetical protein [Flavobacterium laiguense]PWA11027.1 hypothetical protein DB891_04125 [Flavobacterium laiguense]